MGLSPREDTRSSPLVLLPPPGIVFFADAVLGALPGNEFLVPPTTLQPRAQAICYVRKLSSSRL